MRSKGNAPSAEQKRWHDQVASLGCVDCFSPAQIHHPVGATAKHNKIAIGHWWVLPLCDEHHRALHAGESFEYDSRKLFEKGEYARMLDDNNHPVPEEVEAAIMDYHR